MKALFTAFAFVVTGSSVVANSHKFSRDRAAILAMAGAFEVEFEFRETIPLSAGYELRKPYSSKAKELVKVAEDHGTSITLQHLLVIEDEDEDEDGPAVIKHWAQIWKYEDCRTLSYEGGKTWLPVIHTDEETKGTWTQFVTQTDDSPRYKAQGRWIHMGNTSTWTSRLSTRPLPRREYSKRSDYDLLMVTNQHIITPDGWVHQQDNRKLVSREGMRQFLCMETGLNQYKRVSDEASREGFELAEKQWDKTREFWAHVRRGWDEIIENSEKPIRYATMVDGQRLRAEMNGLARKAATGERVGPKQVNAVLATFLR